jgi:hypothetical protein
MLEDKDAEAATPETKMGIGVKSTLVAKENKISATQKAAMFSLFNLSLICDPSRILDAIKTPRCTKSVDLSMLTKLLSKTRSGSATKTKEREKAARFRTAHNNNVTSGRNPNSEVKKPNISPMSHPTSVKPS